VAVPEPKRKFSPKGFRCECGKFHRYPGYVYAHFRNLLDFTCDECGAKHSIVMGRAERKGIRRRKSPFRKKSANLGV
jgi:RNase P subunit RPR2